MTVGTIWKQRVQNWSKHGVSQDFQFRVIDAVKPAISMSISVGFAFYLDFKQPYWAAFAVLMMSFSTSGQAFRRALVGIPGTIVGGLAALTIFSIFPQAPIFLFPTLILYSGICMYFLQACKVNGYFFFASSFVALVVITTSIPHSDEVFAYALARLEETCLGMTVYTTVTLLLWRRSAWPILQEKVGVMTTLHSDLFKEQMRRIATNDNEKVFAVQRKALRLLDKIEELVGFAVTDSFEVWENRTHWHSFIQHSRALVHAQLRWGWVVPELRKEYMKKTLPELSAKIKQMEARLIAMKQGSHAEHLSALPFPVQLERNEIEFTKLPYYLQAQVVVVQSAFNEMASLVHAIMHYHCYFHDYSLPQPVSFLPKVTWELPLNVDYLIAALQSMVVFSTVVIIWYFCYPPGLNSGQFLMLGGAFALISVFVKTHSPLQDAKSYALASLVMTVVYVCTLQNLTTYYGLGTVMFCITFIVYFVFVKPDQVLLKLALLLAWLAFPKFSNVQVYDFQSVVNSAMSMALAGVIASLGLYFISYPIAELHFLRERRRFFASATSLLELMPKGVSRELSWFEQMRLKICLQNFIRLPQTMLSLAGRLDKDLIGVTRGEVGKVIFSFELLGEALFSLYRTHMKGRDVTLPDELQALLNEWRKSKILIFNELQKDICTPDIDVKDLQKKVRKRLSSMEQRIEQFNEQAEKSGKGVSQKENEVLYLLLERNRGLSNAVIEYFSASQQVDWEKWAKVRF
ncbi:FUSC family protein [Halodesulfovibrio spirochaetisodalis]|uniref:Fusaric acid resistance protein n=1 Tax=Halodesulfovibrio spirochaetisodalis TaxID=1560234 RepID=A0A1B7XCC0_9BACT|nr:FUSC family protein [Halodesulfovibrio spirochaetisodalis]OBQ51572.1 hypothetical protein SP90_09320 [Halodesulfovibrio spirochaetisodalis]